jgi:hypothetical protein
MNETRQLPQRPPDDDEELTEADRRNANIFLIVCFVLILGTAYWLIDALLKQRDLDNCVGQGRRNCNPITTPDR